jgi:hypothetical protein
LIEVILFTDKVFRIFKVLPIRKTFQFQQEIRFLLNLDFLTDINYVLKIKGSGLTVQGYIKIGSEFLGLPATGFSGLSNS